MAAKAGFKDLLLQKGEKFALIGALGLLGLFLVWGIVGAMGADNPDKLSKDLDGKSSSVQTKISSTDGKPTDLPDYAIPNTKKSDFTLVTASEYQHLGKTFEPVAFPSQRREQPRVLTPVESQINFYGASYKAYDRRFVFDKETGDVISVTGGYLSDAVTKPADRDALKTMHDLVLIKKKPPGGARLPKPNPLPAPPSGPGPPPGPGSSPPGPGSSPPGYPSAPGKLGGGGAFPPGFQGSGSGSGMFPGAGGTFASGNRSESKVVYRSIEDATKLNLPPAVALYPIRMAVIQMSFPLKAQLDEIKQALRLRNLMEARLESSPATITARTGAGGTGVAPAAPPSPTIPGSIGGNVGSLTFDNSPAFVGLIVERLVIPEGGLPANLTKEEFEAKWQPFDHQKDFFNRFTLYDAPFVKEEGYKPYMLRPEQGVSAPLPILAEALNYPPDTTLGTIYTDYKRLEDSKAKKKSTQDVMDKYKYGATSNPYGTPPAATGSFPGNFGDDSRPNGPGGPGGMMSSGNFRPPLGGMYPGTMKPPSGEESTGTAAQSNLNKLDVDHLLMRFLDVELEPGNTYQYRVKVQMKSPNFKNKDNVSDINMANIETLVSAWYELPQKLSVPQESFLYAYSAKKYEDSVVKMYDESGKADPIRRVAELQDVKDGKRAVIQVQQWMERLMLGTKEEPIGAWVQAEMPVAVGEFVGRKVPVELPLWRSAALHFVLPQGDAKTPIYPTWPKDTNDRKHPLPKVRVLDFRTKNVLVDFEGGHTNTKYGTQIVSDVSTSELLIIREDGKLELRSEAVDMVENVLPVPPTARAQRDLAWHDWLERVRKLKDTETPTGVGSGPVAPGRPGGDNSGDR